MEFHGRITPCDSALIALAYFAHVGDKNTIFLYKIITWIQELVIHCLVCDVLALCSLQLRFSSSGKISIQKRVNPACSLFKAFTIKVRIGYNPNLRVAGLTRQTPMMAGLRPYFIGNQMVRPEWADRQTRVTFNCKITLKCEENVSILWFWVAGKTFLTVNLSSG